MTDSQPIERFTGIWRFLSNFFDSELVWEGERYRTAEHAFNAGKTLNPDLRRLIAAAKSPGEAKARGRRLTLRPGWDETVRYQVMEQVLYAKFAFIPERAERLLSTGNRVLIEGNDWHDTHWGVCSCANHGYGDNHLGRLLMELRQKLRGGHR